jgi:hypothetical protein
MLGDLYFSNRVLGRAEAEYRRAHDLGGPSIELSRRIREVTQTSDELRKRLFEQADKGR